MGSSISLRKTPNDYFNVLLYCVEFMLTCFYTVLGYISGKHSCLNERIKKLLKYLCPHSRAISILTDFIYFSYFVATTKVLILRIFVVNLSFFPTLWIYILYFSHFSIGNLIIAILINTLGTHDAL